MVSWILPSPAFSALSRSCCRLDCISAKHSGKKIATAPFSAASATSASAVARLSGILSLAYGPDGRELGRYDKIHLFDVKLANGEQYLESAYTMPGQGTKIVDCDLGVVGLSICYDLRFPELYRRLVAQKAQILTVPSAFSSTTGPAHWHTLLRARAIENFCYVVASAQEGTHASGRVTYGHSLVVDPWGDIIAEKQKGAGLFMVDIDLNKVGRARKEIPSLEHRHPDI